MSFNPQYAKLGEVLIHEGFATEQQVSEAIQKQKNYGTKIGETLIKLGFISERDLLNALHLQLEYDIIEEDELLELDSDIVKLIPEPFAIENRVIALRKQDNTIQQQIPSNLQRKMSFHNEYTKPLRDYEDLIYLWQ